MEYTTNLNLKKPGGSDTASIGDINDNMDVIDAAMPNIVYSASEPATPTTGMIWLKPIS